MRKIISCVLVVMMLFVSGCSKETVKQKTEEELKEEIRAEMQEGQEQNSDLLKNIDRVYDFINEKYPKAYTREDFDMWTATYLDVTLDGNEDLVYTTSYFDGKLKEVIFITVKEGEYQQIPSNIELAKYDNKVELKDDFIAIHRTSGGSSMSTTMMSLHVFDGSKIVDTGAELIMEDVLAIPGGLIYELTGAIENDLTDFIYTATIKEEDHKTGEEKNFVEKTRYIYDKKTMQHSKENLNVDKNESQEENTKKETDSSKKTEIKYDVRKGSVYLNTTGKEVEVYNPATTTIYKDDGYGEFTMQSAESQDALARSAHLTENKKRLYFTINPNTGYSLNTASTLYLDLATGKVHYVGVGAFTRYITDYPYTNYTIVATDVNGSTTYSAYNSANQLACELGVSLEEDMVTQIASAIEMQHSDAGIDYQLSGFTAETINNEYIDYSEYIAVVVPMHSTVNLSSLTREVCSFSDNINNVKVTFSIFGEMQDVKVTYYDSMDATPEVEDVGTLENAYLDIYAAFSTDMSYVKVTGKIHEGEGYYSDVEFVLDDMRDMDAYEIYRY